MFCRAKPEKPRTRAIKNRLVLPGIIGKGFMLGFSKVTLKTVLPSPYP